MNSNLSVCANQGPVSLFAALGGTPNPGRNMDRPGGGANNGTLVPGTDPAGVYTYTVTGIPPCSPASATVTVTVDTDRRTPEPMEARQFVATIHHSG